MRAAPRAGVPTAGTSRASVARREDVLSVEVDPKIALGQADCPAVVVDELERGRLDLVEGDVGRRGARCRRWELVGEQAYGLGHLVSTGDGFAPSVALDALRLVPILHVLVDGERDPRIAPDVLGGRRARASPEVQRRTVVHVHE